MPKRTPSARQTSRKRGQLGQLGLGMRLLPAAAQKGVGLGRVEIETIAMGREEAHRLGALGPGPGPAEKALDQAELGGHRAGSSALIAAWTAASISLALEAGRDRLAEAEGDDPGRLTKLRARPQPAAVDRDRHDRQLQRAVEAGEARLERRPFARRHPRSFREDHDRPAFGDRRLGGAHHPPQRRRAGRRGRPG